MRPPTPAERQAAAELERRLRAEGLGADEAEEPVSRRARTPRSVDERGAYVDMAAAFLDEHAFANAWDREVWALHAADVKNPAIVDRLRAGAHPRAYLRKVQETVVRLRTLMLGRISMKRRRGRPADLQLSRSGGCVEVNVRFNEIEAGALFYAEDKLRLAGVLPAARKRTITITRKNQAPRREEITVRDLAVVVRLAVKHFAGRL